MKFTHELRDGKAIFRLSGRLFNEADRNEIASVIQDYLENKGIKDFIFDFSELQYINSSGLGIFISLYTKIQNRGGSLILCNPPRSVRNLLNITKLDTIFDIRDSVEEALQ